MSDKKIEIDEDFIAKELSIEVEEDDELSLLMLDEFKGNKGDEDIE